MATNFDDVGEFHEKFGLANVTFAGAFPREVPFDLYEFRLKFLKEELEEFEDGWKADDPAMMADALIDLVYVAMGTAHVFGFPWQQLWEDVQAANMAKERALSAEDSARGSSYDVIKPPGWVPPDTVGILNEYGWP